MIFQFGLTAFLKKHLEKSLDRMLDEKILEFTKHASVYLGTGGFILTIIAVYLKRNGMLHNHTIPDSYFASIYLAFSLILFYEVISMIYALPKSVAHSIGKQYEVMSLVLIRHVFEKAGTYTKIHNIVDDSTIVLDMVVSILGSLLIFFLIGVYSRIQEHANLKTPKERLRVFVFIKKAIAVVLFVVVFSMGLLELFNFIIYVWSGGDAANHHHFGHDFYANLFTIMIFVDILMVLLTMQFGGKYPLVFRNTGLMISTVILRISFTAALSTGVILMVTAVTVGILSTLVYNFYRKLETNEKLEKRTSSLYADSLFIEESGGFVSIQRPDELSSDFHYPIGSGPVARSGKKKSNGGRKRTP